MVTVGQILHYYGTPTAKPLAAIVCAVNADETVTVFVLNSAGVPYVYKSMTVSSPSDPIPQGYRLVTQS